MKKIIFLLVFIALINIVAGAQTYRVVMKTTQGKILLELFDGTPKHRDNFVKLAHKHFYDGLLFHRVIAGFMIQGGDPDSRTAKQGQLLGDGDVGYTIPAEFNDKYFHQRGALAQARDDNPAKASSGCQFYIVTGKKFTDETLAKEEKRAGRKIPEAQKEIYKTIGGAPHLDGNYTVYGQVLKGMDVADKIVNQKRDKNDRPLKNQVIEKVRIKKKFLGVWL
ncbi:peptidylprolyl isomerase [Arachidicoccus ginsenosidimutans]|uniref:peptidylprolyl isomerase n=1 Tax=Arachidicoccus sp. BS20 TaxID=1850526 RepID=UPI0007F08675|nr:peptidylprolyl isomerase [Arachidicoccus sp. BS20]ANI89938.1 peptidylprolyl isomerase [Arachidicoccus sp. BS20]